MGGYLNSGPFFGTLNITCRIIIGTQKGTIILTTTHMLSTLLPWILQVGCKASADKDYPNVVGSRIVDGSLLYV